MFCQREAAETAIFLAEVAGRTRRRRLAHAGSSPRTRPTTMGLPRVGAEDGDRHAARPSSWRCSSPGRRSTRCTAPRDARFAKRFLVVTPGHHDPRPAPRAAARATRATTTDLRDLDPRRPRGRRSSRRRSSITNYHTFLLADAKEIKGVAANTRKILKRTARTRPVQGDAGRRWWAASLRDLAGRQAARSSCSTTRPTTATRTSRSQTPASDDAETRKRRTRNEDARVWFKGLQAISKQARHQADLRPVGHAVLPQGLRLQRGLHLPVDGQRLLADGRDRVGHRQGAAHAGRRRRRPASWSPTCACGTTSATSCRRRSRKDDLVDGLDPAQGARGRAAQPAPQLRAGVRPTGSSDARGATASRRRCSSSSAPTPSCRKLVYDWIAGEERRATTTVTSVHEPGELDAALATSSTASGCAGRARSSSTRRQLESGDVDEGRLQAGRRRTRSRRSRPSTAGATPAPTSTRSPTRTCSAR